jgi:creatinine amidohydrolase
VLVAPILLVGQSPYHLAFPGSIALSAETLQRVYFEAAQSLITGASGESSCMPATQVNTSRATSRIGSIRRRPPLP